LENVSRFLLYSWKHFGLFSYNLGRYFSIFRFLLNKQIENRVFLNLFSYGTNKTYAINLPPFWSSFFFFFFAFVFLWLKCECCCKLLEVKLNDVEWCTFLDTPTLNHNYKINANEMERIFARGSGSPPIKNLLFSHIFACRKFLSQENGVNFKGFFSFSFFFLKCRKCYNLNYYNTTKCDNVW